jgi:hypothetical protein
LSFGGWTDGGSKNEELDRLMEVGSMLSRDPEILLPTIKDKSLLSVPDMFERE